MRIGKIAYGGHIMAAPLESLAKIFGCRLDGIVGGDLIHQLVVQFDYARSLVRLYRPDEYALPNRGASLPLCWTRASPRSSSRCPCRTPSISGAAGAAMQIYQKVAQREGLIEGLPLLNEESHGIGVVIQHRVARGSVLSIGPYELRRPTIAFSEDFSANPELVGLIGIEVLRRFTVTFDYSHNRVHFEPNGRLHQPFLYDSSGVRLHSDPPSFATAYVSGVVSGSPAQKAGLQSRDVLLALDGHELAGRDLESIRNDLYDPGRRHRLTVSRDGKRVEVLLVTREMLP